MFKIFKSGLLLLISTYTIFVIAGCKKEHDNNDGVTKEKLSGYIQKGPFINGTNITMSELNTDLSQTGKTFTFQTLNNEGLFQFNNIQLISNHVQVKSDGFYFNENTNLNSIAPITLYALTDISNSSTINVNILTQLEYSRVNYLVGSGQSFGSAKSQAQQEVLNIFKINGSGIVSSELLNISQTGNDNAILLAVSVIAQGYRNESDLMGLLSNISSDIRTDGVLNDSTLGTKLINDAKYLDLAKVRSNIETKFQQLGVTATIPAFEPYVNHFIDSCGYTFTNEIVYPQTGNYGINLLNNLDTVYNTNIWYSIAANVPQGCALKIIIKVIQGGNPNDSHWGINAFPMIPSNWTNTLFDYNTRSQTFNVLNAGEPSDLEFQFMGLGTTNATVQIEYYENNSVTPTKIKIIHVL